jgi:hypothetical protein
MPTVWLKSYRPQVCPPYKLSLHRALDFEEIKQQKRTKLAEERERKKEGEASRVAEVENAAGMLSKMSKIVDKLRRRS